MEEEITTRAIDFITPSGERSGKPFFAYVSLRLFHMPTLPHPEFAGKTGNGDWADCLAEMDYSHGPDPRRDQTEPGIEDEHDRHLRER